eukprot:TRINITY_DN4922_c1_g1_i1.p1 TRINITY_DN4922_c1_g1~~TRINITY_DN4922_c1_g1_i1.p1  ORF type:complete len:334 (+),score=32.97 TRINITY_DN4922_c1_g1_i1:124-1125(+)
MCDALCSGPCVAYYNGYYFSRTGNDMARNLGYGRAYSASTSLTDRLYEFNNDSRLIHLDRWKITCIPVEHASAQNGAGASAIGTNSSISHNSNAGITQSASASPLMPSASSVLHASASATGAAGGSAPTLDLAEEKEDSRRETHLMNNYCSFGADAKIVLDFHNLRNNKTYLFTDRTVNLGWYAGFSATTAVSNLLNMHKSQLRRVIRLFIDGEEVVIPKQVRSIVIMNLLTYGGSKYWGSKPSESGIEPAIDDGFLEVIAMTGVAHLGAIQTGVSTAIRLGQGCNISLITSHPLPTQVDGEPMMLPPSVMHFTFFNRMTMIARDEDIHREST